MSRAKDAERVPGHREAWAVGKGAGLPSPAGTVLWAAWVGDADLFRLRAADEDTGAFRRRRLALPLDLPTAA